MPPVHFLRDCVNPPEILPQAFLGKYRRSCECCVGQVGSTHMDGVGAEESLQPGMLPCMWAEQGWAAARGTESMAWVEERASCSAGTAMCAWSRSMAIILVTVSQSETVQCWYCPKAAGFTHRWTAAGRKEPFVSWLHSLQLWDLGPCLVCWGGCWFLLSLQCFLISCFHPRDTWLSSAWHLVSHASKCN